jgi:hypothetical protein
LEDGEDESLLGTNPRSRALTSQDIDLLAQHEDLDVLRARGAASEQAEPEHLTKGDRNESESHSAVSRMSWA